MVVRGTRHKSPSAPRPVALTRDAKLKPISKELMLFN